MILEFLDELFDYSDLNDQEKSNDQETLNDQEDVIEKPAIYLEHRRKKYLLCLTIGPAKYWGIHWTGGLQ